MHRKSFLNLLALLTLFALWDRTAAAQTRSMSLADCVQYAFDNNPELRIAQLQVTDAEWRIKENLATGLPQLSAGVTYNGFIQRGGIPASALSFGGTPTDIDYDALDLELAATPNLKKVLEGFGGGGESSGGDEKLFFSPVHSLSGNISLNQLIFSNSYLVAKRATRYYRAFVTDQLNVTRQTVRNQVIDAYLPALLISDNLITLDKNIANLDKLFGETREINKAGFAEQLDVDRLELSLTSLRSERGNLVRQREIVVNALKLAMGMPVSESIELSDDVTKLMAEYGDADLTSALNPMNRPEYVNLLKGRELSAIQVDLYHRSWLPTVAGFVQYQPGLQGGFGKKDDPGFNKWYFIPQTVGGISITTTLFDSGGNNARKQRARIAMQTIDVQKQQLENVFLLELENARKQYLNAQERVANQQKNLTLAQRIYDTTQTKYKAGIGSSFELVTAEQQLYTAQQSLMQAQYDLLSAKIAVRKALGGD